VRCKEEQRKRRKHRQHTKLKLRERLKAMEVRGRKIEGTCIWKTWVEKKVPPKCRSEIDPAMTLKKREMKEGVEDKILRWN
jgi:hypothetical protein